MKTSLPKVTCSNLIIETRVLCVRLFKINKRHQNDVNFGQISYIVLVVSMVNFKQVNSSCDSVEFRHANIKKTERGRLT